MPRAKKTADVPTDRLDEMLARLKLSGIREQIDNLLDEAARANLSARETLSMLCEREIARKDRGVGANNIVRVEGDRAIVLY